MKGGFSLTLSEDWPPVAVKHLSQRSALMRFTGDRPAIETTAEEEPDHDTEDEAADETDEKIGPDRGYFVDVKTLAAALTSRSHSLASLSELLKVPTPKKESDEHSGALTPDYVRYGLRDVQTTWECFDHLARRFASFGLRDTGLYDLYSEASLGKAYLRTMGIKSWQEVQRGFPLHLVGAIMSAYFGGRAEVHIRRQITRVVHTDFLSMYPTVCTLMGLWSFVRANGVTYRNDTSGVTALLARPPDELVEQLRTKDGWKDLTSLVQVKPKHDLFPIRARYPDADTLNIGLNFLSADDPQWFTLADVSGFGNEIRSKISPTSRRARTAGNLLGGCEPERDYPIQYFDFLGYESRPRTAVWHGRQLGVSFLPRQVQDSRRESCRDV